ncbi:MBL fold metallo-hydrolase [Conexibacter woesei]|uniref:Beta-lactamase domain protein n=1 Tax=Conexibacter woesei (strain DSM 14684 / CCUG 47730 / CIP 108061 / JCM 11494 / NBRC 100937 / ID131577) TaxID=469383 RepID=D3F0L2_CONWI|nr:MBL fold metallo-hydrolase [Conexibacter woesei]ADB53946.1 beta-lactamase domain protein [Conexibacter woesei DSM 14684]
MKAVSVHPDVIVVTSRIWKTTATAVRSGGEAFLIDSPILPDELEILPALMAQAEFPVNGLLVTHADWDHLLGQYAFPDAAIGCGETTAARLTAEPGAAARELRAFDEEYYVDRPRPLSIPGVQALPVPGYCAVGEQELELHPADGHTADGTAIWIPWARVLVVGDYLSSHAIPELSPGASLDKYLTTLRRLAPLVSQADVVVPGHGEPLDAARAAAILREDVAYLEGLQGADAEKAPLPLARRSGAQRNLHQYNLSLLREGRAS